MRGSGGVGFLIKLSILDQFSVSILDSTTDDILWIKLIDKLDNENVLYLCSCYLPPSGSSRGDGSQGFYDILTAQMYQYQDDKKLLILGDFNGRIGKLQDFNEKMDYIPKKQNIDEVRNPFGDHLIQFLKDNKLCVLNGRGDPRFDNYTCVSP